MVDVFSKTAEFNSDLRPVRRPLPERTLATFQELEDFGRDTRNRRQLQRDMKQSWIERLRAFWTHKGDNAELALL